MLIWESCFSALSLSLDAFAAALCVGACTAGANRSTALRMGMACGAFQFFMPFAGWLLGIYCLDYIASFDHWVAFGLLALVGGNMIRSSFTAPEACDAADPTRSAALFYLALATSIDALAVGAGFALVDKPVFWLAGLAGAATAALCFSGVRVGRMAGLRLGRRVESIGGTILILIGLNILYAHLWA
jgi:putative Mn2+ efflux pump MntP